ncbi:hypothetical protein LXL04_003427 [Taraxacum kok-saghyz]
MDNSRRTLGGGVWARIVGSITKLHDTQMISDDVITRALGDGAMFWTDRWCGTDRLGVLFPRLYALTRDPDETPRDLRVEAQWQFRWRRPIRGGEETLQLQNLMVVIASVSFYQRADKWTWELETSGDFTVQSIRSYLDGDRLPVAAHSTRWNRSVPIKINIFLWRVILNRLPSRAQLVSRGIHMESV